MPLPSTDVGLARYATGRKHNTLMLQSISYRGQIVRDRHMPSLLKIPHRGQRYACHGGKFTLRNVKPSARGAALFWGHGL